MPRVTADTLTASADIVSPGPVAQLDLSASNGPGGSLAASSTFDSGLIPAGGFKAIAAAVKMSQAGTLTVTRYVDLAGLLPQGVPSQTAVNANAAALVNVADGLPFAAFRVTLANGAGSASAIAAFALLLNAA